jgi:hypothetical protein
MDAKVRLNESEQPYYQINIGRESYELICEGLNWRRASLPERSPTKDSELDRISQGKNPQFDLPVEITNITDDWERWRETLLHMVLNDVLGGNLSIVTVDPLQSPSTATITPKIMSAHEWEQHYLHCDENADEGVYRVC